MRSPTRTRWRASPGSPASIAGLAVIALAVGGTVAAATDASAATARATKALSLTNASVTINPAHCGRPPRVPARWVATSACSRPTPAVRRIVANAAESGHGSRGTEVEAWVYPTGPGIDLAGCPVSTATTGPAGDRPPERGHDVRPVRRHPPPPLPEADPHRPGDSTGSMSAPRSAAATRPAWQCSTAAATGRSLRPLADTAGCAGNTLIC